MTKTHIKTVYCSGKTKHDTIELTYYITSCENKVENRIQYGAEIQVRRREEVESCAFEDITSVKTKILEIVSILSRNSVTPATFRDILEDIL